MNRQAIIAHSLDLLQIYRHNFQHIYRQMAQYGGLNSAPLYIVSSLREQYDQIQQIKKTLQAYGERVLDHPNELMYASSQREPHSTRTYSNLPAPIYNQFVMRTRAYQDVVEGLHQQSAVVLISGLGGTGKTSLANEVAGHCLEDGREPPRFDAVVWVSYSEITPTATLDSVLDEIAYTLDYPGFARYESETKRREVERLMHLHKVLLVVDNFETTADGELLQWLLRLPQPSKALVTARDFHRGFRSSWPVELRGMSDEEAFELIEQRLHVLKARKRLNDLAQLAPLITATGGNPKAIEMALGLIFSSASPQTISQVIDDLKHVQGKIGELFDDLFTRAWNSLIKIKSAQTVLMSATLFPASVGRLALIETANISDSVLDHTLEILTDLALLDIRQTTIETPSRYTMHPLVRAFAQSKMRENTRLEQTVRKQWVEWAAQFASENIGWCWNDLKKLDHLDPEEAAIYDAINWSAQYLNDVTISKAAIRIAYGVDHYYYVRGLWDKKQVVDQIRIDAAHQQGNLKEEARALAQHVQLLCTKGDITEAQNYLPGLHEAERRGALDSDVYTQVQHALAFYDIAIKDFNSAYGRLKQCEHANGQLERHLEIATIHWISTCLYRKGQIEEAERYFLEALTEACKSEYQRSIVYCQLNLAQIALDRGSLDQAEELLTACLEKARDIGERRYIAQIQLTYARLYIQCKSFTAAYTALAEADDLFNRLSFRNDLNTLMATRAELTKLSNFFHDFTQKIRTAPHRTLLLDYDGTLAPFKVERDQAIPYEGVRDALTAILRAGRTHIVIISGRSVQDLVPLLNLDPRPEMWGTHGWERLLPDGTYEGPRFDDTVQQGLDAAREWITRVDLTEHCENKPASIALHWRGLDTQAADEMAATVRQGWEPIAESCGLNLEPFDGGIELTVSGKDKGLAVQTILSEKSSRNPDGIIAYLGDDLTDEDAFNALKGRGIGILVRTKFRPTAATLWLRPPEELLAFLTHWQ